MSKPRGKAMFDTGNPMLNSVVDGFIKVGGVGAIQAASKESYRILVHDDTNSRRSVERAVQRMGRDSVNWGLAAGMYTGVSYGIQEARGVNDWKNAVLAGAVTGAAITLANPRPRQDHVVHNMITGGAIATAAEILRNLC
ncbi:hypothetical protein SELMODRAFT_423634 [Selaginella moellendorffii]|uniref:Uncharacterized protein n=1 Tax=Selaginella moellendorffii TaxID=88036 RepID=D8SMB9_SELML|nr:outer envelope pore protein 16, chloroplastic [Selaginella moellendorffii]EFJ14466.1 hypothetical protein SELMODRAFT_423634 [Selaginella moellendorffii]|eukprot:XP_002984416.1 outer envelope pore protein 16, chloroplastic [Selaginella moellendorffii]